MYEQDPGNVIKMESDCIKFINIIGEIGEIPLMNKVMNSTALF